MWMAPVNKLSTKIKLHNMGLLTSANCTLCHDQLESVDHLYLNKIYLIWFLSDDQLSPSSRHLAPAPTNVRQAELRWLFQPDVGQAGIIGLMSSRNGNCRNDQSHPLNRSKTSGSDHRSKHLLQTWPQKRSD